MKSKKLSVLVTVSIIVFGVLVGLLFANQKKPINRQAGNGKKEPISTSILEAADIPMEFEASGTIYALDKIDIYAEVSGVLIAGEKPFKAGVIFKRGETLLRIDDSVYRSSFLAQKSSLLNKITLLIPALATDFPDQVEKWNTYLNDFDLEEPLKPLPPTGSDRERNFIAALDIYSSYYNAKSMEATWHKYFIRAPYDGVVTESFINPGMLVRNGQQLGEFTNPDIYELEAPVSINDINNIHPGNKVILSSDDFSGEIVVSVNRINKKIDEASQTVKVYIQSDDRRLRDGMYVNARIIGDTYKNAFKVPSSLILEKSKIFIVQDSILTLANIKVVSENNGFCIIQGLPDKVEVPDEALSLSMAGSNIGNASSN